MVQLNRSLEETGGGEASLVNNSVISGHAVHVESIIPKALFKGKILLSSDFGDETRL